MAVAKLNDMSLADDDAIRRQGTEWQTARVATTSSDIYKQAISLQTDLTCITCKSHNTNDLCNSKMYLLEASYGAAARGVTVKLTGCGFDPH